MKAQMPNYELKVINAEIVNAVVELFREQGIGLEDSNTDVGR